MLRQDYLLRLIEQMAQAIARIAGLRERQSYDEALELLETSCRSLGADRKLRELLTPESLAALLGTSEKIEMLESLLQEEALLYDAMGDPAKATASLRLARELSSARARR